MSQDNGKVSGTPLGTLEASTPLQSATWEQSETRVGCEAAAFEAAMAGPVAYLEYDPPELPKRIAQKVVITLNIGNYEPAIRALTIPLMQAYARKIRAEFVEITERKHPDWPIVMEKFQVAEIAKSYGAEWAIFFDADALINPEFFDVTVHMKKDTVLFNGRDVSGIRSYPDKYFLRDGRSIGACDWFAISSDWCYEDLYRFPEGRLEDHLANIFPSNQETQSGCFKDHHLIDDYTLSRNIARFGLKHDTAIDICGRLGFRNLQTGQGANVFLFHLYNISAEEKLNRMLAHLSTAPEQGGWGIMKPKDVLEFKAKWGVK